MTWTSSWKSFSRILLRIVESGRWKVERKITPEHTLRFFCSCESGKGSLTQGRRERRGKPKYNDRVAGVCHQITKRLFTAENAENAEKGQTLGWDLRFSGFQSSGETFGARPPALSLIEGCIVTCLGESQISYLTSQDKP
jgi:hypothetical protein